MQIRRLTLQIVHLQCQIDEAAIGENAFDRLETTFQVLQPDERGIRLALLLQCAAAKHGDSHGGGGQSVTSGHPSGSPHQFV